MRTGTIRTFVMPIHEHITYTLRRLSYRILSGETETILFCSLAASSTCVMRYGPYEIPHKEHKPNYIFIFDYYVGCSCTRMSDGKTAAFCVAGVRKGGRGAKIKQNRIKKEEEEEKNKRNEM